MIKRSLVIIGGGSAGMAAAIAAFDNGIKDILILERTPFLGGILNQCVHDGFGLQEFKEALTGPEFLSRFVDQINDRGIEYKLNTFVSNISKDKTISFSNDIEGYQTIQADAIIVSTGCYERSAGSIGLPGDRVTGIITAGQAQYYLNESGYLVGKRVFILGSGDIGLIMARRLTLEGAKVLGVAELMPYSNGLNRNIVQCLNDFNIPLYLSHTVTKTIGKNRLEKIVLSQVDDSLKPIAGTEKEFEVDTLLLSVGLVPYVSLLSYAGIEIGPSKGALVNESLETSVEGIFCCGNCLHVHDLVDLVVEESRDAGRNAARYINGQIKHNKCCIKTKAGDGIGYVVPGLINLDNIENKLCLKYRVRRPVKNVKVELIFNGKTLISQTKSVLIPSEMQKLFIDKSLLDSINGDLILQLRND